MQLFTVNQTDGPVGNVVGNGPLLDKPSVVKAPPPSLLLLCDWSVSLN